MRIEKTPATENVLPNVDHMLVTDFLKFVPGIGLRTLRYWCESGAIPASKRGGGRWWIDLKELRAARKELEWGPKSFHEAMMSSELDGEEE